MVKFWFTSNKMMEIFVQPDIIFVPKSLMIPTANKLAYLYAVLTLL